MPTTMTTSYYVATVHLLIKLDEGPGLSTSQAAACDAISGLLSEVGPEACVVDWAYARTLVSVPGPLPHPQSDEKWAVPTEIQLPDDDYEEGEFLAHLPASHKIA